MSQRHRLHVAGESLVYGFALTIRLHILQHYICASLASFIPFAQRAAVIARHHDEHSPGTDRALIDNNIKKLPTFTCLALHRPQTYTKMAFSFGFSGDDVEEDPNDVGVQTQETGAADNNIPPPIPAKAHDLDELVCSHQLHKSKSNCNKTKKNPRLPMYHCVTMLSNRSSPTSPTNSPSPP